MTAWRLANLLPFQVSGIWCAYVSDGKSMVLVSLHKSPQLALVADGTEIPQAHRAIAFWHALRHGMVRPSR